MADEILSSTLQLNPDESSGKRSVKMVNAVEDSINDLNKAIDRSAKAQSQQAAANDKATKSFIRQQLEIKKVIDTNGKLIKQQASAGNNSGQGVERGLSSLAQVAGGGPAADALRLGADVTGALDDIGGLKTALVSLGPVGIAAGLGIAAVSLALVEQNKIASETTAGLKAIVERERQFYELRVAGTTNSIQAAVKAAEFEQKVAQARVDDLKVVEQGYKETAETLGIFTGAVIELGGAIGVGGLANVRDARVAYDEANKALAKATATTALYAGLLDDTSTATNDAAAAEAELLKQRQLLTDQLADVQISTLLKVNSLSEEAANKRLEEINLEITTLQQFIDSGTLSSEKTAELSTRITKLGQEAVTLNLNLLPLIQSREREAAAIEEQKRQLDETAAAAEKYTQTVASIESNNLEARASLAEAYGQKVEQIAQNAVDAAESALRQLQQRKADLARDLARAGEEADRQAAQDAIDQQIDAQREELKALRSYQDEVKRINRDGRRGDLEAIQDRDAVALDASQRQRQDALADAKENLNIDRRERAIANAQASADQRTQYAREREERFRKFNQDLADANAAYQQDLALAAQKRAQDLARAAQQNAADNAALTAKYNQQLALARSAAVQEITLAQRTNAQILASDIATRNAQLALARQLLASVSGSGAAGSVPLGGGSGSGGSPYLAPPSLDTGGRITRTGLAMVHRGEEIRNPKRGQTGGGGVNINLNGMMLKEVNARSKQQAIDVVVEVLKDTL